uniref:LRRCT domain-containing protein n=1 Tax=Branchiostoma floridae TaxID=7739 RepID=C3YQN0_BRAFL|eukprot:XP_002601374.1 hypothetical protein BRAFLDRAFT_82684 [Branchiostoma floridae]
MLFLLFLTAVCAASDDPGLPKCKAAGWHDCVPTTAWPRGYVKSWTYACAMCNVLDEGVAYGSPFPFLAGAQAVAIRGHPFYNLSAESLTPLDHSVVRHLALIEAKIPDVEKDTFARFPRLHHLSLDSNKLTHVKQTWFTGLKELFVLILSNNLIKEIDPGSFAHLDNLCRLDLENNLLQVVDPAWLFGLKGRLNINLGFNEIDSIFSGSFKDLKLATLDLTGNDLSSLDGDVFLKQSSLVRLHISSGMLSSFYDAKPHGMMWSLHRFAALTAGSVTMVVEVPYFIFCARHYGNELSFGWMVGSSDDMTVDKEMRGIYPGKSCGALDRSLSTISIQAPMVVLATDGTLADKLVPSTVEQCRMVWEHNGGITMGMTLWEGLAFRMVSIATREAAPKGIAMSFVQTSGTNTFTTTEPGYSPKHTTITNVTRDIVKNITCILLTEDEHTELFFTIPPDQTPTTPTTYKTDTDHSNGLAHNSQYTSSVPRDNSTLKVSIGSEVPPTTDHVLISVVVSAVVILVVLSLVVLAWKLYSSKCNAEYEMACDDAHVWTIPPGVAFPGLLRSASLPACSNKMTSDDVASCRSLPAVLDSIEPTYSEIPDDIAAAQRPLPGLPQEKVRSASLPAVSCTRGGAPDDAASCKSLPAILLPNGPTYSVIPDHLAAAQRPLPALPRTAWEISDHGAAAQRPLPVSRHTYSEIPDDESGPMPFYADAAELLHHVVRNSCRRQPRRAIRDNTTASSRHLPGRSFAAYGLAEQTNDQPNSFYRMAPEVQGIRARRQLRLALVSRPADQGLRKYINVTDAILSRGQNVTEAHIAFLTLPNTYWPWEIAGDGNCITPRRASLPLVTPPNTYWPWEIPVPGTRNTPRRASLPHATLPNNYWPRAIPGEGTPDTPRRASLSHVTPPNTYWPWEIPVQGTHDTPRRASLLYVTPPNTYWPWAIPGEGTLDTQRRATLPHTTLPNTYWPWEIPGEGTHDTPRRASLPHVTLPNTYWPWAIPGEGTHDIPRRASLPHVTLPNTYWPWAIPGEGTHDTPRRASLPRVTLPNTYWPWAIPGQGTHDTPRCTSVPRVALPNTYWPWAIPGGEGTHDTPRRASLPHVTPPNTYWPWAIPGEGTHDIPRRASLPHVTLPNTYWPWAIPGEGTHDTPRRASLPRVTLPNTYWPWAIPGQGTHDTPRCTSVPRVALPNTYWPWAIPGEGTHDTRRRASLPHVTLPNTYWPWAIPGEGTYDTRTIPEEESRNTRASLPPTLPMPTGHGGFRGEIPDTLENDHSPTFHLKII